jgi:hypothetical protein
MFANEYSQQPITKPGLGIALTLGVWLLTAHYVVFFQKVLKLERMPDMLITLFTELFLHFSFL